MTVPAFCAFVKKSDTRIFFVIVTRWPLLPDERLKKKR